MSVRPAWLGRGGGRRRSGGFEHGTNDGSCSGLLLLDLEGGREQRRQFSIQADAVATRSHGQSAVQRLRQPEQEAAAVLGLGSWRRDLDAIREGGLYPCSPARFDCGCGLIDALSCVMQPEVLISAT